MSIYTLMFFILGVLIGNFIPEISMKIIKYKIIKGNIKIQNTFYFSSSVKLLVTALNGLGWAVVGHYNELNIVSLLIIIQITIAILITYIDINVRIIPNELVLTVFIVGIIYQTINFSLYGIIGCIMSMIFIIVIFTAVAGFMGFGKVGAGDVKFAGAIGFTLGYPLIITAVFTMAIVLLTYILFGLAFKKIQLTTMLPLAPFLSAGYLIALLTVVL